MWRVFSNARSVLISNGGGAGTGGVVDMFAGRKGWGAGEEEKKVSGGIDRQARCQGFFQSRSECLAVPLSHFLSFDARDEIVTVSSDG